VGIYILFFVDLHNNIWISSTSIFRRSTFCRIHDVWIIPAALGFSLDVVTLLLYRSLAISQLYAFNPLIMTASATAGILCVPAVVLSLPRFCFRYRWIVVCATRFCFGTSSFEADFFWVTMAHDGSRFVKTNETIQLGTVVGSLSLSLTSITKMIWILQKNVHLCIIKVLLTGYQAAHGHFNWTLSTRTSHLQWVNCNCRYAKSSEASSNA